MPATWCQIMIPKKQKIMIGRSYAHPLLPALPGTGKPLIVSVAEPGLLHTYLVLPE